MNITVHSYRGGTGKSMISSNLALILALNGSRVCLLDMDLYAPSLFSSYKNQRKAWINDYLNRVCEFNKILNDYTPPNCDCGKLYVGLANPSPSAIREVSSMDRKKNMNFLTRLLALKKCADNKNCFDFIVVDTSPGLQYSSISSIVVADLVLVISSFDKSDLLGTWSMIRGVNDLFEKKTKIIFNKVPENISEKEVLKRFDSLNLPIIDGIYCSCDLLRSKGNYLFSLDNPTHPFTEKLENIALTFGILESKRLDEVKNVSSNIPFSLH